MTQRRIHQDEYPYFITANTLERAWFFDNVKYAETLYKIIIEEDDNGTHYYYSAVYLDMENQDCGWRID